MKAFRPGKNRFEMFLLLLILVVASSFKTAPFAEDQDGAAPDDREAAVNEQDSLALVAFFHATNSPTMTWITNTNWLTGPVDTWYGVTVTEGRVTRVELAGNDLGGGIPADIGDLVKLQVLDVQANELVEAVPAEITNLTALEQLHLNDNDLRDLPDLSALGALTSLSVENNLLTFEDLEPNVGLPFSITYAPQAPVDSDRNVTGFEGESVVLHVPDLSRQLSHHRVRLLQHGQHRWG